MDFGLTDRVALVLGGSGGLGRAIAVALAAEGAKVAVAGRSTDGIETTRRAIATVGGHSMGLVWDLGDLAQIDTNISKIEAELGPVEILINNTGGPPPTPAAGQDPALWTKQFQAMVLSVIATTDRVLPNMRARRWGRIITSASSGVVAPLENLGISNTLRASLVGWSKTLAREVGRDGVTANVILPGRIATARVASLDEAKAKRDNRPAADIAAESAAAIPLGRYGTPEEFAAMAAFLASDRASYITGSVFRVDGGIIPSV